jgi:hypothetical protein
MMPATLNSVTPWLPTSMALELIAPSFAGNQLSASAPFAALGLGGYTLLFTAIAASRFRPRAR